MALNTQASTQDFKKYWYYWLSIVGALQYLTKTKQDIVQVENKLFQRFQLPNEGHESSQMDLAIA